MAPAAGELLRLHAHQVDEAAALAASALLQTPAWTYIFEGLNEGERLAAMTWFMAKNFRLRLDQGSARCAFAEGEDGGGGGMVCIFAFQPPVRVRITARDLAARPSSP